MDTRGISSVWGREHTKSVSLLRCGCVLAAALGAVRLASAGDQSKSGSAGKDSGSKLAFIDQAIEEGWKKAGIRPAGPARDDEFLRRAYVDLLGRIPNVAEAKAFLSTRESDKRAKLIEYLLDHPDYAKSLATDWTILLVGRSNQGRMVDRERSPPGCESSLPRIAPGTKSSESWWPLRAPTRKTEPSIMSWPTLNLMRCR